MIICPSNLKDKKACQPGTDWLIKNHPGGVDHSILVQELVSEGRKDFIGWLAVALEVPFEERVEIAGLSTADAFGRLAMSSVGTTMETRVDLVKRSTPAFIGRFLRDVPGLTHDQRIELLALCDDKWKRKLKKLLRI